MSLLTRATILAGLLSAAASLDPSGPARTYELCQRKTCPPTTGCPVGTLYVSQTDKRANFTSIHSAIASLGNTTTPGYILIDAGVYTEQLNVTRSGPLTLLGQSSRPWQRPAVRRCRY